jgi:hypothetical protein
MMSSQDARLQKLAQSKIKARYFCETHLTRKCERDKNGSAGRRKYFGGITVAVKRNKGND